MKNAKKSMFITTILMVAVLVVAISTATFAWYTASGEGTASGASLTSAESADANIGLGWTAATATSANIDFTNSANTFAPMAINTVLVDGTDYAYDNIKFTTATVDDQNNFNTPNANATPWVVSDGDTATGFYVRNNNQNAAATVKIGINYTTEDDGEGNQVDLPNNDILCVAVFVNGNLKGIFTKQSAYAAGTVTQGQNMSTVDDKGTAFILGAADTISIELTANNTSASGDNAYIQVKAWFDGTDLNQTKADMDAGFTLTFVGTTKTGA